MLIEEKFVLKAPIAKVWAFLIDPAKLGTCVPGCEKLEVTGERTYTSVIKSKVGPISVQFKFDTTLTEVESPKHLKAVGAGKDTSMAGNFSHETVVDLVEISPGQVEVHYRSNVGIVGRLATFGDRIMRAKAKEMGEKLVKSLKENIEK